MNTDSENLLLLSCRLGDPERRPLTPAQLRLLMERMRLADIPDSRFTPDQLVRMGIEEKLADRILLLIQNRRLLHRYLSEAEKHGCVPITIMDAAYPAQLRRRLGDYAPACLWLRGDPAILDLPAAALVGSRELRNENRIFAEMIGTKTAQLGAALVSGNARGADICAQESALNSGGQVISVVSDMLCAHAPRSGVLYISEDGWDEPFSVYRALHRNYTIHSFGSMTFAAQCTYGKGGTWSGCMQNLKKHWTPLYCFRDGSPAFTEMSQLGAVLIDLKDLDQYTELTEDQLSLY